MIIRYLVHISFLATLLLGSNLALAFGPNYPVGPDPILTPGKLCQRPDVFRYPERIAYCERDVTYESKMALIQKYDEELGFHIRMMNRGDFKIDHYIPLCAGGSNDLSNLWPQHRNIYKITDPIEPLVCEKMSQGKLSQRNAVILVMKAKRDLRQVPYVLKTLHAL